MKRFLAWLFSTLPTETEPDGFSKPDAVFWPWRGEEYQRALEANRAHEAGDGEGPETA